MRFRPWPRVARGRATLGYLIKPLRGLGIQLHQSSPKKPTLFDEKPNRASSSHRQRQNLRPLRQITDTFLPFPREDGNDTLAQIVQTLFPSSSLSMRLGHFRTYPYKSFFPTSDYCRIFHTILIYFPFPVKSRDETKPNPALFDEEPDFSIWITGKKDLSI